MSFMERAKAKAAALRDKSKEAFAAASEKSKEAFAAASEKIDDMSKPCVQCGSKAGVLRYDCAGCNTQKFCFKCTDYCAVSHEVVPVFTAREKAGLVVDATAEKSQELYRKALLKWKSRKNQPTSGGNVAAGATVNEGSAETDEKTSSVEAAKAAAAEDPNRVKVDEYTTKSVCRLCFRSSVHTLDLNRNFDIIGPYDNEIVATIIAVHGGGNSRGSLRRMAEQLIPYKIRSILVDLPGHGGRMDEKLTIDSAMEAINVATTTLMQQATEKDTKAGLLLLMGVGLGGYIAVEYLGRASPKKFDGAIIVNAGMGVGKDEASLLSRAALSLATSASEHLGAKTFVHAALRELKKTPTLMKDEVHANLIDTGLYMHSATDQLTTLKSVATKAALNRFFSPVLYMDGSKDFHDMVDVYTKISVDNELRTFRRGGDGDDADGAANDDDTMEGGLIILSRSIQYPNGNHHFLHDTRFADESYADIAVFVQQLAERAELLKKTPSLVLSTEELSELIKRQQAQAEALAAAAAAAAAAKPSVFERAKAFVTTSNNSNAANSSSASAGNTSTSAAANSSVAGDADASNEINTRASVASVAVPFVAQQEEKAQSEYASPPREVAAAPAPEEEKQQAVVEEQVIVTEENAAPAADEEVTAARNEEEAAAPAAEEPASVVAEGEDESDSPAAAWGKKGKKGKKGGRN